MSSIPQTIDNALNTQALHDAIGANRIGMAFGGAGVVGGMEGGYVG